MTLNKYEGGRAVSTEGSRELSAAISGSTAELFVDAGSTATSPDGTKGAPFASVAAAMDAVTSTKKTIILAPGTYEESVEVVWPKITGVALVGVGDVVVRGALGAANAVRVAPGAVSATFEATIENIEISHRTGQIGLKLDNTSMTKKLIVYLNDFGTSQEGTGNSIDTTHGDASNAIRIYAAGQMNEIEGLVNLSIKNDGDIVRFANTKLTGGITTSADAIVSEITIQCCELKHEGVAGGNAAQVFNSIRSWTLTGATYAAVDSADLAGSHTEVIV